MAILTKANLIEKLAENTEVSKAQAERFLNSLQDIVVDSISAGDDVKLAGFAAFESVERAARSMRNPRTGEPLEVPAATVVRIRPLKRLREAAGGDKE